MPLTHAPILVVAHDAGGAAVLSSIVSAHKAAFRWSIAAAGPAVEIFRMDRSLQRRVFEPGDSPGVARWMSEVSPALVLTGTGWQSNFELDAIMAARSLAIPSAAFLDHWVNFRERFGNPAAWRERLPDHILVGDRYAYGRAVDDGFPPTSLIQIENPYLRGFLAGVSHRHATEARTTRKLLFVSEPTRVSFPWQSPMELMRGWEFDAVEMLVGFIKHAKPGLKLRIRLHPSEHRSKYSALDEELEGIGAVTSAASDKPLQEDIRNSDAVFGIGSMALLVARAMGCPVATILPPKGDPVLPHTGIANCYSTAQIAMFLDTLSGPSAPTDMALFRERADFVLGTLLHPSRRNEPPRAAPETE